MEIIFRADGDSVTGLGHIMRSSALMQMLQPDFSCRFFTRNIDHFPFKDFKQPPRVEQFSHAMEEEAAALQQLVSPGAVIVLDGYKFETGYQQSLKQQGFKVVCIDDIMQFHFVSDLVINHAGGVSPADYSAENYTRFCLGPSYALVKPIFQSELIQKDLQQKTLLINLGGADPVNETGRILNEGSVAAFSKVNVVLGGANRYAGSIINQFKDHPTIRLFHNIASTEMYALMKESAYAILSPSTICYEYMSTTGVVYLSMIADNQQEIFKYFIGEALAFDIRSFNQVPEDMMLASIQKQQQVFDHNSAARFRSVFASLLKMAVA